MILGLVLVFPLLTPILGMSVLSTEETYHFFSDNTSKTFDPTTDITLNLYTRKNPTNAQKLINGNDTSIKESNYNAQNPTKMLVHGWNGMPESPGFRNAFLNASDCNVIMVNWTAGAKGPEGPVLMNAPKVGTWLATALDWLSTFGPVFKDIHMVGISLGSHVVGIAARESTKGQVDYITVCDPSKRSWENNEQRINAEDAVYVEAIHTNTAHAALSVSVGDTDFYPNGGATQPGCTDDLCSHIRAFDYFVDSIDNQLFKAKQCAGLFEIETGKCSNIGSLHMGGMKPKYNKTGIYFLETNPERPFYKG